MSAELLLHQPNISLPVTIRCLLADLAQTQHRRKINEKAQSKMRTYIDAVMDRAGRVAPR